jgi:replicative DNA helicase
MKRKLSDEVIESLIIKGITSNKQFLILLMSSFESRYFDHPVYKQIYEHSVDHYKTHLTTPDEFILKDIVKDQDAFNEVHAIDFDIIKNYDFLIHETNAYLKEKAIKQAILDSVDVIEKGHDVNKIREITSDALAKDLTVKLGLNYWNTLGTRLKEILLSQAQVIPTYFPMLDEFINGGLIPYSLSLFLSRIHGFKTTLMINMMERWSAQGKNTIMFSMETSENEIAKRIDSISTLSDINKMHTSKTAIKELGSKLAQTKKDRGIIVVKEFPTGQASVADFRNILREYQYRGITFDVILADYITIMSSEAKMQGQLYSDGKKISEELRALSLEFQTPVVSVSQLNRGGIDIDFKSVDYTHIGESLGIAAAADFMAIMGKDEEDMVYDSELLYKIVKNRLGGRVGETGRFYVDKRSLRIYDESELNQWQSDATSTGDERKVIQKY